MAFLEQIRPACAVEQRASGAKGGERGGRGGEVFDEGEAEGEDWEGGGGKGAL